MGEWFASAKKGFARLSCAKGVIETKGVQTDRASATVEKREGSGSGQARSENDVSSGRRERNQSSDRSASSRRETRPDAPISAGPNAQKSGRPMFDTAGNQMPYQTLWLEELVQTLLKSVDPSMAEAIQPMVKRPAVERQEETGKLMGGCSLL